MKDTIKLFPLIHRILTYKTVILTLVLTSLLFCGLEAGNNTAAALPATKQISSDAYSKDFVLRTNQISQIPNQVSSVLPKRIANAIKRDASKRSNIPIRDLQITQVTQKTFSNPCVFKFGEICTQDFNPVKGWEVLIEVDKQSWTYHVNQSGTQILLDPKISTKS